MLAERLNQIEIFFREIKQLLHIKSFIGTTQNAAMIQIWTALITIVILKFLKEIAKYAWQLSNLVAFLRLNLFVKIDLYKWLDKPFDHPANRLRIQTQGVLFYWIELICLICNINWIQNLTWKRLGRYWSSIYH